MNLLKHLVLNYLPSIKLGKNETTVETKTEVIPVGEPQNLPDPGAYTQDPAKRFDFKMTRQRLFIPELRQDELFFAIQIAENPSNPRRYLILSIYREVMRDAHLKSQINTAINKVISSPFCICDSKTGEINKDLTELFKTKWFENLNKFILEADFWGHSLVEFGIMSEDEITGEWIFKDVKLFPREYVRPETHEILLTPTSNSGFDYTVSPFSDWLIEAGEPTDIGLLHIAARHSIFKRYAYSDWSRSAEKWGDPLLVIGSSSDDDEENKKKEEFAANFGNNGYVITDDDDKIQLLERKNGSDSYGIFDKFIDKNNEENSKLVNGQTGTADNQAWAGTADTHMEILDEYTKARLRHLMYYHNDVTIPFLIKVNNGNSAYSKLKGFKWMPLEMIKEVKDPNQSVEDEAIDNVTKPTDGKKPKKQMPLP